MAYFSLPASKKTDQVIVVDDVTMIFNMASENMHNLKEYFIKLAKRELFFKEFRALKNISFTINRGEVVGLVGTNGSGKSTMLKIIAGVLEASEGNVTVRGSISPLIELGAGFDYELTARENVYLNGALLGYSKEFIDSHFTEIIDFAELHDFVDMPLKNYSSGMVARIAFAVATITEPDVLIVDETLSVGDVFFQRKCEARIQSFIENGDVTVLFVSHSMDQVERICDRAIWIEKGEMRMDAPVAEVCAEYRSQFKDIGKDIPFAKSIHWLSKVGISHGYADGTFRPEEALTRSDAATFISRLHTLLDGEKNSAHLPVKLLDIPDTQENREDIQWAVSTGLIPLVDEKFLPAESVSHAQFASILQRLFKELISQAEDGENQSHNESAADNKAILWLIEKDLISQDLVAASFAADTPILRGEMAEIFFRFAQLVKPSANK